MALVLADRVKETCNSPGTGTVTLLGAVTGFQSFATIGNGNTCYYTIADQTGSNWEVGIGTYTSSGTTLARTTVLSSSAGGTTKANFSSGVQDVFVTYPSEKAFSLDMTLGIANGGTNGTATPTAGAISYGTGLAYAFTSAGTTGQVLSSNGTSSPTWIDVPSPNKAGGAIAINSTTASVSYTIAAGTNGLSVGPITISDGVAITISSGQRWVVI